MSHTTQGSNTPPPPGLVLRGDGRYGFTARVDGEDLVVSGVRATWFGGAHDPADNGQTASGVSTRLHPDLLGCALPMNGFRLTRGSPLPDLPWMTTTVEVTRPANGRRVAVPLIDLGPAAPPHAHAAIDLTVAAFRALGGDLREGDMIVDYRVRGGALRLPAAIPFSAARASRPNARETPHSAPDLRAAIPAVRHAPETANRTPAPAVAAASPLLPPAATPFPAAGAPGAGVATVSSGAASGFAGRAASLARREAATAAADPAPWPLAA